MEKALEGLINVITFAIAAGIIYFTIRVISSLFEYEDEEDD